MNITNRMEFLRLCVQRMQEGTDEHGRFDPRTETRDMPTEALAEAADISNYMEMFLSVVLLDESLTDDEKEELFYTAVRNQVASHGLGIDCISLRNKYRSMKERKPELGEKRNV
jgi:hypothetical protein